MNGMEWNGVGAYLVAIIGMAVNEWEFVTPRLLLALSIVPGSEWAEVGTKRGIARLQRIPGSRPVIHN